ncbi:MAG: hypothetical protein GXX91_16540 [Verrucomicrobiaceae bacterium]|nr:hypothetical protein [Verrucomicrobiaceae bacterium]
MNARAFSLGLICGLVPLLAIVALHSRKLHRIEESSLHRARLMSQFVAILHEEGYILNEDQGSALKNKIYSSLTSELRVLQEELDVSLPQLDDSDIDRGVSLVNDYWSVPVLPINGNPKFK